MAEDESTSGGGAAGRRAPPSERNDEGGTALIEISLEGWKDIDIEDRGKQLEGINQEFRR
jgi:hypothetical protein